MLDLDPPKIITVTELLLKDNLQIPSYQRPYKWTSKNVSQLIDDIIFHNDKSAYRLGTLVLHKYGQDKDGEDREKDKANLDIVDGQQRTITLSLIAYAIIENRKDDLKAINQKETWDNYKRLGKRFSFSNDISKANIQNNYKEIERRIKEFDKQTIAFFFHKCELVQVIPTDISEAFQFFDSQNARGKDLEPHDLLKAFHLREMNNYSTEDERRKVVEKWELMDTEQLSKLFALYLFRIRNWSKGYSAKYFSKSDVDVFKGVNPDIQENYPFARIFRIAHYYTENYNRSYHRHVDKNEFDYPFQIDQTIINGRRFFEMVAYYDKMINRIINIKGIKTLETIKIYNRTGDKYIRNLFYCGLIYYIDKFGEKELLKSIDKIFIWAYTLRLKLFSVGLDSVNNYALNKHHSKIQLFQKIREAISPNEILNMKLEILTEQDKKSSKTEEIVELFKSMKYYECNN